MMNYHVETTADDRTLLEHDVIARTARRIWEQEGRQAPLDRVRRQRSRSYRRERGSQTACAIQPQNRFIPGELMSARVIVMPSGPQSAEGETNGLRLRGPDSTPTALLSANSAAEGPSNLDDSEELLEDLLRRFETADLMPWWHGGAERLARTICG